MGSVVQPQNKCNEYLQAVSIYALGGYLHPLSCDSILALAPLRNWSASSPALNFAFFIGTLSSLN